MVVGFFLFWFQRLLYGPLRPIETEQLYEKAWFAVTETCLAMTIFRGELGGWFLVMFISLLVGKVWGWIGEGRVEFLEQQPPANPRLFHTRLAASLAVSVLFNVFMLQFCVHTVLEQARPDMMVMFGFEFAVLSILSLSTAARYCISLVEIYVTQKQLKAKVEERRAEIRAARQEAINQQAEAGRDATPADLPDENDINEMELDIPGWEEKGRWIFYLDLATDFFKLTVYLSFFAILFTFYGLPIHILRDVVLTIRSFGRRIMDFVRYRNATRDMNERYPDATADEVSREDVCIICREEMTPWQPPDQAGAGRPGGAQRVPDRLRPKKLPCGHILHFACLRSWLERQQNCPTCRRPVVMPVNRGQAGDGGQQGGPQNVPGGRNGPQADGLPRARVYQFGPFRIGFGAGRGDLFHNLHRQIHQGNAPAQPAANLNPHGARQVGVGFGFGGPPPPAPGAAPAPAAPAAPTPPPVAQPTAASPFTPGAASIQDQIQHVEQQIIHEVDSLRLSVHQLQIVRLLQAELLRLRGQQPGTQAHQGASVPGVPLQGPPAFPSSNTPTPTQTTSVTTRRQFISTPQTPPITNGDSRLPEGLSLPQGWSLIPLQSSDQQSNVQPGTETTASTVPDTSSSQLQGGPAGGPLSSEPSQSDPPAPQPSSSTEAVEEQPLSEETVHASNSGAAQALPKWGSALTAEPTDQNTEPQAQTNATLSQPTGNVEQPSAAVVDHEAPQEIESFDGDEGSSKGKGRAATVEDVDDDAT